MVAFPLKWQDVLYLSLAVNGLLLLQLLTCRFIELLMFVLRGRSRLMSWVSEIHRTRPGLVGRIIYEQLSLWTLVILVTVCLKNSTIATQPFQELNLEQSPAQDTLIRATLSLSTAFSLLTVLRLALGRDVHVVQDHAKLRATVGLIGNSKADMLKAVIDSGSKLICFYYYQNMFLGLTALFYELDSGTLELYRLMELLRNFTSHRTLKRTAALNLMVFLACRVLLPIVFSLLAFVEESPLVMDTLPLVWFFVAGAVNLGFHCYYFYQSVGLVTRPPNTAPPLPRTYRTNQSGTTPLDALSNDIHDQDSSANRKSIIGLPFWNPFEYIFLRSYDNRNVSCLHDIERAEKTNILRKKDVSKGDFLYIVSKAKNGEEISSEDKISPIESTSENINQVEQEFSTEDSLLNQSQQIQETV